MLEHLPLPALAGAISIVPSLTVAEPSHFWTVESKRSSLRLRWTPRATAGVCQPCCAALPDELHLFPGCRPSHHGLQRSGLRPDTGKMIPGSHSLSPILTLTPQCRAKGRQSLRMGIDNHGPAKVCIPGKVAVMSSGALPLSP